MGVQSPVAKRGGAIEYSHRLPRQGCRPKDLYPKPGVGFVGLGAQFAPRPRVKSVNHQARNKMRQLVAHLGSRPPNPPQQQTQTNTPPTTTNTEVTTPNKQCVCVCSVFVGWEGSWRGVGDVSSLTGHDLSWPRHPQPGRGYVPGPPTYIHDVLVV